MDYDYKKLQNAIADIEKQIEVLYVAGETDEYKERALELTRDLTKTLANLEFFNRDITDISEVKKVDIEENSKTGVIRAIKKFDSNIKKLALSYLAEEKITKITDALNSLFHNDLTPSFEMEESELSQQILDEESSVEMETPVSFDAATEIDEAAVEAKEDLSVDDNVSTPIYVDFINAASMIKTEKELSDKKPLIELRATRKEPERRALSVKDAQSSNLSYQNVQNPKIQEAFNSLINLPIKKSASSFSNEMQNLGIEPIPPKLSDEEALKQALTIQQEIIGVTKPRNDSSNVAISELSQLIMSETADNFVEDETPKLAA